MSDRTDSATAVVEAYFEAVAHNDIDALKALVTDDFVQNPPPLGTQQDREAFIAEWSQRIEEDPHRALKYERSHRVVEDVEVGSRTGAWVHEWGTYRRSDGGLTFKLSASFQIDGAQIREIHAYFDRLDIMSQAGFTLTPPQSE